MSTVLGTCNYTYGSGSVPNREIRFSRTVAHDPKTIHAKVYAHSNSKEKPVKISELAGHLINVQMANTSEKAKAFQARRIGHPYSLHSDRKLSEMEDDVQKAILKFLEPDGNWRIEITNDIGRDPRFEQIVDLNIFNPS